MLMSLIHLIFAKKKTDFNLAIVIAILLDPRRKGEYVVFFHRKVCRNVDQANTCLTTALEWMRKYFLVYERRMMQECSYYMTHSPVSSSSLVG
jgi:hypothetical protein